MILANHLVCLDLIKKDCQKVLIRTHQKSENPELEKIPKEIYDDIFFKFMNSAEYTIFNQDISDLHFGLNLKKYTHFTSPIRRYADIIIHRLIKSQWLENNYDYDINIIDEINQKNKISKKLDREFKIYQIINLINDLPELDAYVSEFDNSSLIKIFIPEFKVELKTKIIHSKISNLFTINKNTEKIIIKNNENNKELILERYQKIKIKLFEKQNNKYKIDVNLTNPDIKTFLEE